MSGTTVRQSGVDVLGVASIKKDTRVGTGLLRFTINPRALTGTRLGDYASLWARWRPVKLRLEICPAAGLMVTGAYIAAWSATPSEQVPAGEQAIAHLSALVTQVHKPIGQPSFLDVPCVSTAKWYTFSGESVDVNHGCLLACLAGMVSVEGSVSVVFKLHWTIEFNGPDIPAPLEELILEPGPGWENIFTDSVSDWAGGAKLTFKMHAGGAVVEWPGVESQVVYGVAEGTKIPYYDSSGAEKECKFFSRIIDSNLYDTAICCHATQADAEAYQKTGDLTKILPYRAAGKVATPARPRLIGVPVTTSFLVDRTAPSSSRSQAEVDLSARVQALESMISRLELERGPLMARSVSDSYEVLPSGE